MNKKNTFKISRIYLLGSVFLLNSAPLKALDSADEFSSGEHLFKKGSVKDLIKKKDEELSKKNVDATSCFDGLKTIFQNNFLKTGKRHLRAARTCSMKEEVNEHLFKAALCFEKEGKRTPDNSKRSRLFMLAAETHRGGGHYLASACCYHAARKVPDIHPKIKMLSLAGEGFVWREFFHEEALSPGFSWEDRMEAAELAIRALKEAARCIEDNTNEHKAIYIEMAGLMASEINSFERSGELYYESARTSPPNEKETKKYRLERAAACFKSAGQDDRAKECDEALAALSSEK